jgi:hypothetical protein
VVGSFFTAPGPLTSGRSTGAGVVPAGSHAYSITSDLKAETRRRPVRQYHGRAKRAVCRAGLEDFLRSTQDSTASEKPHQHDEPRENQMDIRSASACRVVRHQVSKLGQPFPSPAAKATSKYGLPTAIIRAYLFPQSNYLPRRLWEGWQRAVARDVSCTIATIPLLTAWSSRVWESNARQPHCGAVRRAAEIDFRISVPLT